MEVNEKVRFNAYFQITLAASLIVLGYYGKVGKIGWNKKFDHFGDATKMIALGFSLRLS